jgi:pirin-like protein
MALDPAKSPPPSKARAIVQRTRGRTHGLATRLMSPSDLGEILKPFVFLGLFDHEGAPCGGLHPHSGIATLTYVAEGAVSYIDPDNVKGTLGAGNQPEHHGSMDRNVVAAVLIAMSLCPSRNRLAPLLEPA